MNEPLDLLSRRKPGRRTKLPFTREVELLKAYIDPEDKRTIKELVRDFGVGKATLYLILERHKKKAADPTTVRG